MTKPGYTHIIVPTDLHQQLKALASQNGISISKLIATSINTGINTVNPTTSQTPKIYTPLIKKQSTRQAPFLKGCPETVGFWWRTRRDLNPRSPAPKADALILTGLRVPNLIMGLRCLNPLFEVKVDALRSHS